MASSNDKKTGDRRPAGKRIAPPKGTRDLYPDDTLRTRYIQKAWHDTSIRCGFDEIEGPTFEQAELYAVKSGDGILGELFQAFSGKSPEEIEQVRESGRAPFALRPEFTPTLARMYAAKANTLPKPCKWFTAGPYFRAERPQRGRLREFLQWNCDVIGLPGEGDDFESKAAMDAECVEVCLGLMQQLGFGESLGLYDDAIRLRISDRNVLAGLLEGFGIDQELIEPVFAVFDRVEKLSENERREHLLAVGVEGDVAHVVTGLFDRWIPMDRGWDLIRESLSREQLSLGTGLSEALEPLKHLQQAIESVHFEGASAVDMRIVRGLAYYTGIVFELSYQGERAVAGGGRYDNLIELMGGPPTPAVGFAMGDVVLGLLLQDKGLMPEGPELMDAISAPLASVRPEAFVISDSEDNDPIVRRIVADLRRGVESKAYQDRGTDAKPWHADRYDAASEGVRPMHARQSYKSTRKLGKLLDDANKQFAKCAVIVRSQGDVTLRDLATREDAASTFSVSPDADNYVGRVLAEHLDHRTTGATA